MSETSSTPDQEAGAREARGAPGEAPTRLLEVWGDTVDARHLGGAVALGVGVAVPLFLLAGALFSRTVDDATLARSYALLVGLVGCLVAAAVCARLFPPQRVLVESESSPASRQAAFAAIRAESGEIGDPALLDDAVQRELHALGLYDAMAAEHLAAERRTAAAA